MKTQMLLHFAAIIAIKQIHDCAGDLTNVTVQVNDFVSNDLSSYQHTSNFENYTVLRQQNLKNLTEYMGLVVINTTIDSLEENDITDLSNLRELSLASAEIRQMSPGCFANLPRLKYLILDRNKLRKLRRGVFNDLPIILLDLRGNLIEEIETGTFENTTQLLDLDLSRNNISKIDSEWFRGLENLEVLQLSKNNIAIVPDYAFKFLENLRHLHLEQNQIGNFGENCFRGLRGLRILDLSFNNLRSVREEVFVDQEMILEELFLCGKTWECRDVRTLIKFLKNLTLMAVEVSNCKSGLADVGSHYPLEPFVAFQNPFVEEYFLYFFENDYRWMDRYIKKFFTILERC